MAHHSLTLLMALALLLAPAPARAQLCGGSSPYMLIVLDKSGSMSSYGKWNDSKNAINNMVSSNSQVWFGLMYFEGSCSLSIAVGCAANTHSAIMNSLNSTSPGGGTEIGGALKYSRSYLTGLPSGKSKFVLLITDGCSSSSCGNANTEAQLLLQAGIKTFVVGFQTDTSCHSTLTQIAQNGGTSNFYAASNLTALNAALSSIVGQVSCCGNGVIDSGEKCDITAPAGSSAACPTSCNDGNKCTKDVLTGSQCTAECQYTPITQPIPGDGCCPPGATSLTDSDCSVVCGNGLLESGEYCDPGIAAVFGKCPILADCNDNNVCTKDALTGSGCHLQCQNTPMTANPSTTDGCCPPGATSLTDKDCSPSCGNGLLESGELCDPGIAAGTGKCPTLTDCDDKNVCTLDVLSGNACTLKCQSTVMTADSTKKDGCCPTGANSLTDQDCPPKCGNGVIESGEKCDTGILSGSGVCPTLKDCDDKDICTVDTLVGNGCTVLCQNTKALPDATKKDGCCPTGNSSKTDADCLDPCGPDKRTNCIDLCKGVTCPKDHYCQYGKCVPFASKDSGTGTGKEDGGSKGSGDAGPKVTGDGKIKDPTKDSNLVSTSETGTGPGNPDNDLGFSTVDGCACQAGTEGSTTGLALLLALGLLVIRRRRA